MTQPKSGLPLAPIPELSRIVSVLEDEYKAVILEGMGTTSFENDARMATAQLLAIIAEELALIRHVLEKSHDIAVPGTR
jgi:hypothetical protein